MELTPQQYEVLLKPLAAHRVSQRQQSGISLSYLEAWDVKAHLIRVFGFGGWSANVETAELAFEDQDEKGRWNVGYRVLMRLEIHPHGRAYDSPTYTEAAVGSATLPNRGEAHDMAIKTAESDALKRAAINLGTQFGLSLYDSGNRKDVVGHSLVAPEGYEAPAPEPEKQPADPAQVAGLIEEARTGKDEAELRSIWERAVALSCLDDSPEAYDGDSVRSVIIARLAELQEGAQ